MCLYVNVPAGSQPSAAVHAGFGAAIAGRFVEEGAKVVLATLFGTWSEQTHAPASRRTLATAAVVPYRCLVKVFRMMAEGDVLNTARPNILGCVPIAARVR